MNTKGFFGCNPGSVGMVSVALAAMLILPALRAEDAGRAARLSSVDGDVRIVQDGQVIADPALLNTPLFEGSQIVTGDDGRAELQFDDGSVARLSPNGSVTLTVLGGQSSSGETEIALERGLAYFELQGQGNSNNIRVRFNDSLVTCVGFTVLRINLDNPPGTLAVFSGNARLEQASQLAVELHGGESLILGASDSTQYTLSENIEPDSWDTWNSDRDQLLTSEAASRTGAASTLTNNENPAWNDLDANGSWYSVPGQGNVWSPYEAANAGWDPYGNGSWMWTPRYGYIWVSGNSWGYMPFQCGAWNFYNDFGWGWAPGVCQPWWGGGGWVANVGYVPVGYHFPKRPHPGQPHRVIGEPGKGGHSPVPYPVFSVDRRPPGGSTGLPVRNRNTPVIIAGHSVEPLRSLAPSPAYGRSTAPPSGFVNSSQPVYTGPGTPASVHSGQTPGAIPSRPYPIMVPSRPSSVYVPQPSGGGSLHPSAPSRSAPAPSRPSGGASSGSRPSGGGGGSPHVSSGGGGGGGSHPSGGGGGSHPSSSGGGHH